MITDNPTVLFDTPIQPTDIEIIYADGDNNRYSLTLYTKDYKVIIRYSRTYIFYRKNEIESIDEQAAYVEINIHNNDFYMGTVKIRKDYDKFNTRIDLLDENEIFDCDDCTVFLNDCKRYNNYKRQHYEEIENSLKHMNYYKQEITDLKKQIHSKDKELKTLTDQKNQENKNSKSYQSTQKTIIIICVLIIVLLLGLCIYLYFKR